jgi:hypothetical protein
MSRVGILAYGSLIGEPGAELDRLVASRIATVTPFPVEFARLSQSRGGAPTVVPCSVGGTVKAKVLVLRETVSLEHAKNLLWRRERRKEGSGERYRESRGRNAVVVRDLSGFCDLDHVLYTDFDLSGKIASPDARQLAAAAVGSVSSAPRGKDGISYLIDLVGEGVVTPLTGRYAQEILRLTGAVDLAGAVSIVQGRTLDSGGR